MSGSSGEMGNLLKQAQRMQQAMDAAREELKTKMIDAASPSGAVRVSITGDGRIDKFELSDTLVASGDKEAMESQILATLREGLERATKVRDERLALVTGGLNLPGLL
ncbi:MAG: DNA-binding YbaB/EbfC family protein [Planctomycetota bacterium]|jgi:DNA-binding YbaB/EbfC family protein